jgi:hypothetical protein
MWYLDFIFADNSDIVRAVYRKAKLKLINNLNFKSNKKKKTYFNSFKLPIPNIVSKKNTIPFTCKTALDDSWAYLSILRAISA